MSRRDAAVVLVLVVVLAVLGGAIAAPAFTPVAAPLATPTPPPIPIHREAVVGLPSSVNPVTARTQADRDLVALLFRGLVRPGQDGRPIADLAAGWTVEAKGARWTFRLRPDASWQDGVPVTSDDVVYTVHVLQDPAYTGPLSAGWQGVTATALDPTTVRFDLSVPLGGFLQAAAQPLLPAHLLANTPVAELADAPFSSRPVGNGPFALTDLTPEAATLVPVLAPFDRGSGPLATVDSGTLPPGRPLLAGLELRFYAGPDDAIAAYRAGEVDAVSGLPALAASGLAGEPATRRIDYPGTTLTGVFLNLRPGAGPFADARVRTALLAAVDRGRLVTDLLGGSGPARQHADPAFVVGVRPEGGSGRRVRPEGGGCRPQGGRLDEDRRRMAASAGEEDTDDPAAHGRRLRQPRRRRRRHADRSGMDVARDPHDGRAAGGRRPRGAPPVR